jgi:hypothetical protein
MKLYWRIKKDGKWTWTPAKTGAKVNSKVSLVYNLEEEE